MPPTTEVDRSSAVRRQSQALVSAGESARRISAAGTRFAAFVLLALVLVFVCAASFEQSARADVVGTLLAVDQDGAPQDAYSSSDAIFAKVSTTLTGGYVCAASVTVNACLAEQVAVTGLNDVPAYPVYAPGVLAVGGHYRLLGFNPSNKTVPVVASPPFTVVLAGGNACDETSGQVCPDIASAYKQHMELTAQAAAIAGFGAFIVAAGSVAEATILIPAVLGGGLGTVLALPVAGAVGFGVFKAGVAAKVASEAAIHLNTLASDPPDPDFTVVAQPQFETEPSIDDAEMSAFQHTFNLVQGYSEAVLHAWERFQGAANAGDVASEVLQAQAAADFASTQADAFSQASSALVSLADRADIAGLPVVTAADLANLEAINSRVGSSGFTDFRKVVSRRLGAE